MKNFCKSFGLVAIVIFAMAGLYLTGCDNGTTSSSGGSKQTPIAEDYDIGGLSQVYDGSGKAVAITALAGKSSGARTIYYEGTEGTTYAKDTTGPINAGSYNVTFDVAAVSGWKAASGLAAGKLVVSKAVPVSGDYNVSGLNQVYDGGVKTVTVTPQPGIKSPGARIVWYTGTEGTVYAKSITAPSGAGSYSITIDVAEDANWEAATGLPAGTLIIEPPELGALRITFSEFGDEAINYEDDINTFVRLGESFTVVVEVEYDYYMWYFNGDYWDEGIDSAVIDPDDYDSAPGTYYLLIIVEKDGIPYSKELTIRVAY